MEGSLRVYSSMAGTGALLIVATHNDGQQLHVDSNGTTYRYSIAELRAAAARAGVELLPWGCETGVSNSGGIKQPFRLRPLIEVIGEAFRQNDLTWGALLQQIHLALGVTFVWDALQLSDSGLHFAETKSTDGRSHGGRVYFPAEMVPHVAQYKKQAAELYSLTVEQALRPSFWKDFLEFYKRMFGFLSHIYWIVGPLGAILGLLGGFAGLFKFDEPFVARLLALVALPFIAAFLVMAVITLVLGAFYAAAFAFVGFGTGYWGEFVAAIIFLVPTAGFLFLAIASNASGPQ